MSTLLSLYSDIWSVVVQYISSDELGRLTLLTPSLSQVLWRTSKNLDVDWKQGWLNLDGCLNAASRYSNLSHLSIKAFSPLIFATGPFEAQILPSNLCSLDLRFAYCLQAFLTHLNLNTITPNLQHLKLTGISPSPFLLGTAQFPPKLRSLSLSCNDDGRTSKLHIRKGDIKVLPQTLHSLELRGCVAMEDAMKSADFSPGLTSLILEGGFQCLILLENLPRTLEKLHLEIYKVRTISSRHGEPLRFPWRAFFPKLVDLYFMPPLTIDCFQHIADPRSLREVPELAPLFERIALDPASSPSISASEDESEDALNYERLNIQSRAMWGVLTAPAEDAKLQHFLPRLTSLEGLVLSNVAVSDLSSLKRLTTLRLYESTLSTSNALPPTLTELVVDRCKLSLLPASLLALECVLLIDDLTTPDGISLPILPSNLTKLTLSETPLTEALVSKFPTTIESLEVGFPGNFEENVSVVITRDLTPGGWPDGTECDRVWRAMAKRFVRLRRLVISESVGCPSMRLEPIASTQLEYLKILSTGKSYAVVPWLSTLLDDRNTDGRPRVLPPSLKTLKLVFYALKLPLSIIPMLPRSLTYFATRHMETSDLLPNFPFNPRLTTTQMLEHLPPNLKKLIWKSAGDASDTQVTMASSSLQYWPRSLEIVDLCHSFVIEIPGVSNSDINAHCRELARLLPPKLSFLRYCLSGPSNICHREYLALPANKNVMNLKMLENNDLLLLLRTKVED